MGIAPSHHHGHHSRVPGCWWMMSLVVGLVFLPSLAWAQSATTETAEQARFPTSVFRHALRQRGLTELLKSHLDKYPSHDLIEKLLQTRELRLAEAADDYLSQSQRHRAVVDANQILEQLLAQHPKERRRFQWRFSLAHSLVYDEAQPYYTRLLYEQARPADATKLVEITSRAVDVLDTLQSQLQAEYALLDQLPVKEFERLERTGYVDRIDQLEPKTEYLLLWAWFYDALPRHENDAIKLKRLHDLVRAVSKNRRLLDTPHRASGIQVQMLLLVGMTHRLMHRHVIARDLLTQAVSIADRISEPKMQQHVAWARTLARVEQIRNERDAGRFDEAIRLVRKLDEHAAKQHPENVGLRIVAGLLRQSIHRVWAKIFDQSGDASRAQEQRRKSWASLARLISQRPKRRDEIYALLYSRLKEDVSPAALDPIEQAALVAGLLTSASASDHDDRLHRAIVVGDYFLKNAKQASLLLPEVLYNIGVAHYRLNQAADAATFFIRVAKEHAKFELSHQAAVYAVQLSAGLYEDPKWADQPAVQTLYLDALRLLVTTFADSKEARYWQFQYAQLLETRKQYRQAANEYAGVFDDHANYVEARFFQLRCLAKELENISTVSSTVSSGLQANEFFEAQRAFVAWINSRVNNASIAARSQQLRQYLAQSKLLAAEVQMLATIKRPALALETLTNIEKNFDELPLLSAQVWRLRLTAFEQLGRLDDAAAAIPAFIKADPSGAGPVLQSLYLALSEAVVRLRASGENVAAQTKADTALLLAQQIFQWSKPYQADASADKQLAGQLQLGEANLQAQHYDRALLLFEPHVPMLDKIGTSKSISARAAMGYSQALYGLHSFEAALPYFNRLAIALPDDHPLKWPALLRDLECRTALDEPPRGIIKVIRQHQYLHPSAGDEALAKHFDKLLRENQRRLDRP